MSAEPILAETVAGIQRTQGGVRVTASDAFLDVLAEGRSGYHFFRRSAEKVVLVRKARRVTSCAA